MQKNKQYFYPLYKQSDKEIYKILIDSVPKRKFLVLKGSKEQINELLKLIVYSGKAKDYRKFRDALMKEFKNGEIDVHKLLQFGNRLNISLGIDPSWAIFTQDQVICELLDRFKEEINEFIKRFLLTQLLQDWRGPTLAVISEALEKGDVNLSKLKKILTKWDFTGIF